MKKILIVLAVLTALGTAPALAQKGGTAKPKPVKTMIDYKDELGLTQEQVDGVAEALKSFQDSVNTQKRLMVTREKEYQQLVKAHAPLPEIKQKLRQLADIRFNLRYADIVTSRKVEGLMSTEQLSKWKAIQAKVRGKKGDF